MSEEPRSAYLPLLQFADADSSRPNYLQVVLALMETMEVSSIPSESQTERLMAFRLLRHTLERRYKEPSLDALVEKVAEQKRKWTLYPQYYENGERVPDVFVAD